MGRAGHDLQALYRAAGAPAMRQSFDPRGKFHQDWKLICDTWIPQDNLRYNPHAGNQPEAEKFVKAVAFVHDFLLEKLE